MSSLDLRSAPRSRAAELMDLDLATPAFVYDELILAEDVAAARDALAGTGARLLLALKAFSFESGLRTVGPWVDGFHASSLFEARLARRVLPRGIVHTTSPGLRPVDAPAVAELSDRLSFNSLSQWRRLRGVVAGRTSPGLRVNPGLSFVPDERYDPCARNSQLGAPVDDLAALLARDPDGLHGIEGLLVHSNAESSCFEDLALVVERLVVRLAPLLRQVSWVNLGGGYLFGEAADFRPLREALRLLRDTYRVEVLVEPGTSLVSRAGSVVATVVDLLDTGGLPIAILDTSVAHMPEVLEYQYSPGVAAADEGCHRYLLAGASCLASDRFGQHCFPEPLHVGSRVVIENVGAYSLVKASWFNGIALPTVYSRSPAGEITLRRAYNFDDFLRLNGELHADR